MPNDYPLINNLLDSLSKPTEIKQKIETLSLAIEGIIYTINKLPDLIENQVIYLINEINNTNQRISDLSSRLSNYESLNLERQTINNPLNQNSELTTINPQRTNPPPPPPQRKSLRDDFMGELERKLRERGITE